MSALENRLGFCEIDEPIIDKPTIHYGLNIVENLRKADMPQAFRIEQLDRLQIIFHEMLENMEFRI